MENKGVNVEVENNVLRSRVLKASKDAKSKGCELVDYDMYKQQKINNFTLVMFLSMAFYLVFFLIGYFLGTGLIN